MNMQYLVAVVIPSNFAILLASLLDIDNLLSSFNLLHYFISVFGHFYYSHFD